MLQSWWDPWVCWCCAHHCCYQTIRARPLLRTLEKTSAVLPHGDTSVSPTLFPQQAQYADCQKQHAKDWKCSHCEFQSVTSVVCFSCVLGVWYSLEVCLALVKENGGVGEQHAAGGGVKDGKGECVVEIKWGCVCDVLWLCSLTPSWLQGLQDGECCLLWTLKWIKPPKWSWFIHTAYLSLAQMTNLGQT